jgi:hypothetical protein
MILTPKPPSRNTSSMKFFLEHVSLPFNDQGQLKQLSIMIK